MKYFDILNKASNNEGLEFNEKKYEQFMKYKDLIKEWNEKINLTAIKEDEEIVKKHFIDSMKVFKFDELKECKKCNRYRNWRRISRYSYENNKT